MMMLQRQNYLVSGRLLSELTSSDMSQSDGQLALVL
jgi:hypothetical protein